MYSLNRNLSIDLVKVLSTFWVVAIWHLPSYGHVFNPERWRSGGYITLCAMSIFMFYSGYCQNKYHFESSKDYFSYYSRRFKRFYVLYFFSLLLLYVVTSFTDYPWFSSPTQFLAALVGMSSFVKPEVMTLWFMSMLMLFYILTPLIKGNYHSIWPSLFISAFIYIIFWGIQYVYNSVDWRLFVLFPFYVIGLVLPHNSFERVINSKVSIFMLAVSFIAVYLPSDYPVFCEIERFLCISCFIIGTSGICSIICKRIHYDSVYAKIVSMLSYCSLVLYLFHREVYQAVYMLCIKLNISISHFTYYLLFLPVAVIVAYIIQKCYDVLCDNIQKKYIGDKESI